MNQKNTSAATFPSVRLRRSNQYAERVLIGGQAKYTLKPGTNGAKYFPTDGVWILDQSGRKWFHGPTQTKSARDRAIDTILWWEWDGGVVDG